MIETKELNVRLRYTILDDARYVKEWLNQEGVLKAFPCKEPAEVDDSVKHWVGFSKYKCSLTAIVDDKPVGIGTLNLMPYRKVMHQCLISLLVDEKVRNKGIGTLLLNNLIHLAKAEFKLEVLYLEVYDGNPAVSLYERFGFREVGYQKHFMKDEGEYVGKITMERIL